MAQQRRGRALNLQYYDEHFMHYGISLAVHTTRYSLLYSADYTAEAYKDLHSIHSENSTGFKLGFIVSGRVTDRLGIRLNPIVGFYENMLIYKMLNDTEVQQTRAYNTVELPLLLKYKSVRRGNTRLYLIGGMSLSIDTSKEEEEPEETALLETTRSFSSIEFGIGLDLYTPFFKFSPELRYSRGLGNVLTPEVDNFYQKPLYSLTPQTLSLILNFEGGIY